MIRQPANKQRRVMIANRGEIASRVAKACRELGHTTIGFWTDNEKQGSHLQFCDEWVYLDGNKNSETYLNAAKIIKIAKENNVDAIHPGYGFLSENADFARDLKQAGIIFIGPNIHAIQVMGDKATSKKLANEAGVPTVPGTDEAVPSIEKAIEVANEIGYPVLLKAVAGGGGRGMRACNDENEIREQFEAVGRESLAAFNNGDLLVEKLISNPRHIEVQILGDKKGNVFHFYERECSIQRRHQKVIEEAPSPFIGEDEEVRQNICNVAIKLAKIVNYDSAGTVEFIMGEDKSFYFLEMNTRIQVEHPITEEITGIDLLICMIQVAFEDDLCIPNQAFIKRYGHAIECRICAEDPITMLPAPGLVTGFETNFPQGTRFDHCLYKGLEVTPDFDPMVGKLICKGMVRDIAIRKMRAALNGLFIEGLKTNKPLLKEILRDKNFCEGPYTTNYIKDVAPQNNIDTSFNHLRFYEVLASVEARKMGI